MHELRPMVPGDAAACEAVWHEAFPPMRAAYHLPPVPVTDAERARHARRMADVCGTDPHGSWVAVDGGTVVGFAQALRRGDLWVLSLLAVSPPHQGMGVAKALLDRALDYGGRDGPGLIMSSRDPKAMHRYVRAGFALHPSVAAVGTVRPGAGGVAGAVRDGGADDLAFVADVDRHLRGAPHGPELGWSLEEGHRLLVLPGRGYAVARVGGLRVLGALDEEAARLLLGAALSASPAVVDVNWMTASQQWAIEECSHLGLELVPAGAVMVRGRPGPLSPYLPSGAYG